MFQGTKTFFLYRILSCGPDASRVQPVNTPKQTYSNRHMQIGVYKEVYIKQYIRCIIYVRRLQCVQYSKEPKMHPACGGVVAYLPRQHGLHDKAGALQQDHVIHGFAGPQHHDVARQQPVG